MKAGKEIEQSFHGTLKKLIHEYILLTYKLTQKFPSNERFGLISQDNRAAVSIMLNYVEGFARMKSGQMLNQYEIAFGSLKESIYCKFLGKELGFIAVDDYKKALQLKERIAVMLYRTIEGIKTKNNL